MDASPLFRILLRQPCLYQDVAALCKLLCSSRSMHSLALELCSGRLLLHTRVGPGDKAEQLQQWLSKYGGLLQELHILLDPELEQYGPETFDQLHEMPIQAQFIRHRDAAIEAGLQQWAATARDSLHLQSLRFVSCGLSHGIMLPHLSINLLTQLELHLDDSKVFLKQDYAQLRSDLARLTSLRHLIYTARLRRCDLVGHIQKGLEGFIPFEPIVGTMLSDLQRLTHLELHAMLTVADAALLPASLVELHLACDPDRHAELMPFLKLGHLTDLTKLHIGYEEARDLVAGDVLPPNTKKLRTQQTVKSSVPFQPLLLLQELHMTDCHLSALDLLQLSALTARTAVGISYLETYDGYALGNAAHANAAAHVWRQLPVVHLRLEIDRVSRAVVEALGQLSKLTHLYISWCCVEAMPHELAGQLQQCTSLRQLWMDDWTSTGETVSQLAQMDGEAQEFMVAAAALADPKERVSVTAAVATLPHLRDLSLFGRHWGPAVPELVAATQLTRLILDACDIDDDAVTALAHQLTNLHALSLPTRPADFQGARYTVACLPALAGLQHLTQLHLDTSSGADVYI